LPSPFILRKLMLPVMSFADRLFGLYMASGKRWN
jgi:hypothetical protein